MEIIKLFSPEEISELISDAHSLPSFNLDSHEMMPESSRIQAIEKLTEKLCMFSEKWASKISKVNKTYSKKATIRY